MTTLAQIQDFLGRKRLAIVGVSRNPRHFSRMMFQEFRRREYDVVPVNPDVEEIAGEHCYARLADIQPPVEGVLLMTKPAVTDRVVRECQAAGIHRVWMYRGGGSGAVSPDAVRFCKANGISVVAGECPFMFLPRTAWFHRLHGFCKKVAGSYPE